MPDDELLILNDQGGERMSISYDVAATLRAQEHGHQPVIAFEPGVMSRDCSAGNKPSINVSPTLRAAVTDNLPAVAYGIDTYNHTITGDKSIACRAAASDVDHTGGVLIVNEDSEHAVAFRQTSFADYEPGFGTLRASGGDIGGGTESLIVGVRNETNDMDD